MIGVRIGQAPEAPPCEGGRRRGRFAAQDEWTRPVTHHAAFPGEGQLSAPELVFWGVRGSVAVPGPDTVVYGGNTACIEVINANSRLIVDAGTGIVALGKQGGWAGDEPIHILLTHLHHDHVQGLPFFAPAYRKDREIHLWCGNLDGDNPAGMLERMFAPPLFPLRLTDAPARILFHGFRAGETLEIGSERIRTALLDHPSGTTGYRFDGPGGSAAIITDIEHHAGGPAPDVVGLCEGVDTLVYDMMLEACDYGACKGWGHSTAEAAIALADAAGARRLVGFHHSPGHCDTAMTRRERHLQEARAGSLMAREGLRLVCAPSAVDGAAVVTR